MSTRSTVLGLFVGFMLGLMAAGLILRPTKLDAAAEQNAILTVVKSQETAWNAGKLEEFMVGYWDSPELIFRSGDEVTRGYADTLARYRKRYQQDGAEMGQLTFADLQVDLLGSDQAIVTGHWQLKRQTDEPRGLFTLRLKKLPQLGWKIISDHTSAKEKS